ncbi:uncharacterized protein CLUP02_03475 [Colletotrichum lupini]|uniref:Uncharacterized protein n=1 Tax=Colletotrichum lupini TaxID=145971 RepID=A0A9Q8SIJ0_9PEZI|nr:uncharacterized protein CLUP02_03475 [Colletotrichum lupini]UQC78001.1 hypothetical protein CLUP02_03475 [Colletotrichum lupini]
MSILANNNVGGQESRMMRAEMPVHLQITGWDSMALVSKLSSKVSLIHTEWLFYGHFINFIVRYCKSLNSRHDRVTALVLKIVGDTKWT